MTTCDKRNAIEDFCNSQENGCVNCPQKTNTFCRDHSSHSAPEDVINEWYSLFFGKDNSVPTLKDSGTRRTFETGAVRDMAEGKGRCDLLPLSAISDILDDGLLSCFSDFISSGDVSFLYEAARHIIQFYYPDEWTAILEQAHHLEDGAKKYGERNWEKGIPVHAYIDSAIRHYLKMCRGDTDEPHDRACLWNIISAIWTIKNRPECNDVVF